MSVAHHGWVIGVALSVCLASGCGSSDKRTDDAGAQPLQSDRAPTARTRPADESEQSVASVNSPEPVGEGDEGFVGPEERVSAERAPASTTSETRAVTSRARSRDGRPEWWLTEPQLADGRVSLCAEALGQDIREARRNAVEKGLALLREQLAEATYDAQVVYLTVRPLPIPAEAPSGARYAGYVMVSGVPDEGDG